MNKDLVGGWCCHRVELTSYKSFLKTQHWADLPGATINGFGF
ncbi:hypothetical protein [Roseibium sp.]|nr:hypothetical protein [Roseibium sp.]